MRTGSEELEELAERLDNMAYEFVADEGAIPILRTAQDARDFYTARKIIARLAEVKNANIGEAEESSSQAAVMACRKIAWEAEHGPDND